MSLFLPAVHGLRAQQFGGNPPYLKWNQINTDTFRIIFPEGLEQKAKDVATIVRRISNTTGYSIGRQVKKINIVLQNQTIVSNGYVSLGPYRSEFFLTPTQNSFELGSLPWHKTLALHEYRHVQQNNNFRKGLTRIFYYVFGEEGQALASNVAIPDWFWEGDAVFQETSLSNQGRGRIPFFFNDYRSLWAADKNYSWMKLRNGSYQDFTPDHYRLGYFLVAYGREKYGDTVWAAITDKASRFDGLFYPFQGAVKKVTGEDFPVFRNEALNFFRLTQKPGRGDSAAQYAKQHRHFDADEEFPQLTPERKVLYVKSSYKKIPAFYLRDSKTEQEKRVCTKDISIDNYFSYNHGKIVYAAIRTDARWTWKNFSVIRMVDLKSGTQTTLTKRTKYFSPDVSGDGKTIVAVLMDPSGSNSIHFLNASSGRFISAMPNENGFVFTYPKFYSGSKIVSAVRNKAGEMALGIFDVVTGEPRWITPFSMNTIAFPQVNSDTICFTMSEGPQEKLFAYINGGLYRFTPSENNTNTGSYHLSVLDGEAVWTAYTAVGYHLYHSEARFEKYDGPKPHSLDQVYDLKDVRTGLNLIRDSSQPFSIMRYPASYRLFNFHSWRAFISDPEYSYSLVGENILNTLQSELYITYNRNERSKETGVSLAYAAWLPVIAFGTSYTFDRHVQTEIRAINWNELNAHLGVSVPLTGMRGAFSQSATLSSAFNTQQVFYTGGSKKIFDNKKFNYADLSFSGVNRQLSAKQQIYPRFAQTFSARYRAIVNKYTANQLLLTGSAYFPGLFLNHSVVVQAAYQRRDTMQQYNFSNGFPISRGYSDLDFPRMWKLGVNYHFPIAYPDCGFGNIVYLLRLRGNLYYDYSESKSLRSGKSSPFRSVGAELYFDTRWWNQLPIGFGVRYSRLLDSDPGGRAPNQWELVLPLNLLSR